MTVTLPVVNDGLGTAGCSETQMQRKIVVAQLQMISHMVRQLLPPRQMEDSSLATYSEGGEER